MPDAGTMAMIEQEGIDHPCKYHVVVREDDDTDDSAWIIEEKYFDSERNARDYGYKQSLRGLHADVYESEYWLGAYE